MSMIIIIIILDLPNPLASSLFGAARWAMPAGVAQARHGGGVGTMLAAALRVLHNSNNACYIQVRGIRRITGV